MYDVYLERVAQHALKKLAPDVFERVLAQLRDLTEDPRPSGCRKIVGWSDAWRIRIGNYRVVYRIDDREKVINVMYIRHRREAYR